MPVKVCLFAGGRGSSELIHSFNSDQQIQLTVLVNGYDDGLSTGKIRNLIPGLLGPSDFRKNFSTLLISSGSDLDKSIAHLLELRILNRDHFLVSNLEAKNIILNDILESKKEILTYAQFKSVKKNIEYFFTNFAESGTNLAPIVFNDMAFGNLLIAGQYLQSNKDFNSAINTLSRLFKTKTSILNVSDGSNRELIGITSEGKILTSEAEIVNLTHQQSVEHIYLVNESLPIDYINKSLDFDIRKRKDFLENLESLPEINPLASHALSVADVIIYGPGTQHSSLLPSYLTKNIGSIISGNVKAKKLFVPNLSLDNDLHHESLGSILSKLCEYLNHSSETDFDLNLYLTHILQNSSPDSSESWGIDQIEFFSNKFTTLVADWTSNHKHSGSKVKSALLNLLETTASYSSDTKDNLISVGIIIPFLNEVRSASLVMSELIYFDWISHGYYPEFIAIDGGSTDGTDIKLSNIPNVKLYKLGNCQGRGEALSYGISKSKSDFIITFPGDNVHSINSIIELLDIVRKQPNQIILGSRVGFYSDASQRLKKVYTNNKIQYFISHYGGKLITVLLGVFHNIWVSDPLTSVRVLSRKNAIKFNVTGKSFDWDIDLILKAKHFKSPVAEIPIEYFPNIVNDMKRITIIDGLRAIRRIFAKSVNK